jgi:hypothetical protein
VSELDRAFPLKQPMLHETSQLVAEDPNETKPLAEAQPSATKLVADQYEKRIAQLERQTASLEEDKNDLRKDRDRLSWWGRWVW